MHKINQKLKADNDACTAALESSNNLIRIYQLTKHISKTKDKIPANVAATDVNMKDDIPSTSTDPPPVANTSLENGDFDSLANTLVNVGYDPQYPQYNPPLAMKNPPEYAALNSPGDICTPSPNSPQASTGMEWNQQVTDQIDQIGNQAHDHHPDAIPPAVTPPALTVRVTRSST